MTTLKKASLITELSAQYTTWPNYTQIISHDASNTIPHSPTSHFPTPPIPVNATKLIKKWPQWGTVQSTRKGRRWLGIKNRVNYVYRNSEIKMPPNVS